MAMLKRLQADLRQLQKDPLPLCAAVPREDDWTLWDACIGVELPDGDVCPLHFLIDFPPTYPQSAPSVGFSFQFPYTQGASYVKSDGRLQGKFVICLDLLGNFEFVHTEWKGQRGSGWSPAYGVSTLLLQLQALLAGEPFDQLTAAERQKMRMQAEAALSQAPEAARRQLSLAPSAPSALPPRLLRKVEAFAQAHLGGDLKPLLALLEHFQPGPEPEEPEPERASVDPNIKCWYSGASYTEAVLGVGVARAGKNVSTQAELLSLEAFEQGLRQGTDKTPFEFFLPLWINDAHARQPAWQQALKQGVAQIGSKCFGAQAFGAQCLEVFPRLINQTVVEMMRPDQPKTEALAYFEALANLWRGFRAVLEQDAQLRADVRKRLEGFVRDEQERLKDRCPDLGCVLAQFAAFQGFEGCPTERQFNAAYVDEALVRNVLWWQKAGVASKDAERVFRQTQVSREVGLFQQQVRVMLCADAPATLAKLEATNGRAPELLEALQKEWRAQKAAVASWQSFFAAHGLACPANMPAFLKQAEERAEAKGPKYSKGAKGAKGEKGKGKGEKGRGKGQRW